MHLKVGRAAAIAHQQPAHTIGRSEMTATPEILDFVAPDTEASPEVGTSAPVLITEQEVALSTAAAMPVGPTTTRRWAAATSVVLAAMRRMSLALTSDAGAPRRDYPKRYLFLENACMAREMERL
ncbi:MAG: hypothetical protein ACRDU4_12120 [Mycobacterium sp.]